MAMTDVPHDSLIEGDCVQVMAHLPAESVDLIVTSPPYNCRKEYGAATDEHAWPEYYSWFASVLDACYRLLLPGGTIAIVVPGVVRWQPDHAHAHTWSDYDPAYMHRRQGIQRVGRGRVEPLGFTLYGMMRERDSHLREPIVWIKGDQALNGGYKMGCDSDPYCRPAHEMILCGSKQRWFHRGGTGRRGRDALPYLDACKDVWFLPPTTCRDHPAPFPVELPRRLIQLFTHHKDSVVLDPFAGSGTTGVACIQEGRRCILIDKEPRYVALCRKRMAATQPPLPMALGLAG